MRRIVLRVSCDRVNRDLRSIEHFIGVDLGGGKGRNTAVAHLRRVAGTGPAEVEVVDYGTGKDVPFYDDQLLAYLRRQPEALIAIDAPLSLPLVLGAESDAATQILAWFAARAPAVAGKKPRYTPYTQRATEVILHEEHGILPRETLGQGMGPLTARAVYLRRALLPTFVLGESLFEVYPKATIARLCGDKLAARYKRSAASATARLEILDRLSELRFAPGAWREDGLANDHKFDAVMCAFTGYLIARGACLPPPDPVVAADGWIWVPEKTVSG
jgi:predicted nuclease with RNAse H fold